MGTWGPGLYSNDDAADFVELVRAVLKLPQPIDELIDLLHTEAEGEGEDETTFWLVLADQLEKKGIHHPPTAAKAITILTSGADIEEMRAAGAEDADLKTRARSNEKLLARLKAPRKEKPRKTLSKPQRAVVSAGDYICFPTQMGNSRNPYFPPDTESFVQDGWGLVHIHDVGWEFEYLNWIAVLPVKWRSQHPPKLEDATIAPRSDSLSFGTLSMTHFKRMQMIILGNEPSRFDVPQDGQAGRSSRMVALNDISISNALFGLD